MTALACLRIMIAPDRAAAGGETLATLVGKVADAFLETRWRWPRRHGEIAPYAFLLADPRAATLDPAELVALSEELEYKLFGTSGGGAVSLASLEGDQSAVTRFAAVDPAVLRKVLSEGGSIPGLEGRISEITPAGVRVVSPPKEAGPLKPAAAVRREAPHDDGIEASFRAVWCALRDRISGSAIFARRKGSRVFHSIVDGPADKPADPTAFDITCLEATPRALVGSDGLLFIPISFSSAIHRPTRETYLPALEALPAGERHRLAAAVYDVPRAPTFSAIAQVKAFLNPYVSFIDLQTADPNFQIDALSVEAVDSVTLSLPDAEEGARLAAATRFMANREAYKRRRIWPAVTNVRTQRELIFCMKLRAPFMSGRAVSDALVAPADPVACAAGRLPLREMDLAPAARPAVIIG